MALQVKLLRFLNDGKVFPLGAELTDSQVKDVKVRIIAATNVNMKEAIEKRLFREDLYYRINTMEFTLQPLFLQPQSLPVLIGLFVDEYNAKQPPGSSRLHFGVSAYLLKEAFTYRWPGNIRELRSLVHRACNVKENRHEVGVVASFSNAIEDGEDEIFDEVIKLNELPSYNILKNLKPALSLRRDLYSLRGRWRMLCESNVESQVSQSSSLIPDERDSLYDAPFGQLKSDCAKWLVARYGNANAASKVADLNPKTLRKWTKS